MRRAWFAAAGGTGVALTAAAATAVLLSAAAPGDLVAAPPAQQAATSAGPPPPALPGRAPDLAATKAYGDAVLAVLVAATPAGYTASKPYDDPASAWTVLHPPGSGYAMLTPVLISAGQRQGQLEAFVVANGMPVPTGDLCSAEVTAQLSDRIRDEPGPCQVVTVGGVAIRVVAVQDPELGQVLTATRFVRGGVVQVIAQQGTPVHTDDGTLPPDAPHSHGSAPAHHPPLASLPFTAQDVAALAADPALVP